MLITTSRKPSQRTRSFCKSIARVLHAKYVNRGKMSIRDVLIKASGLGYNKIMLVSEMKGNPNKIDFQDVNGVPLLSMDVTVGIQNTSVDSNDRVHSKILKMNSEIQELDRLGNILNIPKCTNGFEPTNLLVIKEGDVKNKAVIEFYGNNGTVTGPKIFIKDWRP